MSAALQFFQSACGVPPRSNQEIAQKINRIYDRIRLMEESPLSVKEIAVLFHEIDTEFYHGKLSQRISSTFPATPTLAFVVDSSDAERVKAFIATEMYDDGDPEYATYRLGFRVAIPSLNSLPPDTPYYSGGILTHSKLKFLLLMLLHESIHLVEYMDPQLSACESNHTVFFYSIAYTYFRLVSRLSQVSPASVLYNIQKRQAALREIVQRVKGNPCEDAVEFLYDHSHQTQNNGTDRLLGYYAYTQSLESRGGRYTKTQRRRRHCPNIKPRRKPHNSSRR